MKHILLTVLNIIQSGSYYTLTSSLIIIAILILTLFIVYRKYVPNKKLLLISAISILINYAITIGIIYLYPKFFKISILQNLDIIFFINITVILLTLYQLYKQYNLELEQINPDVDIVAKITISQNLNLTTISIIAMISTIPFVSTELQQIFAVSIVNIFITVLIELFLVYKLLRENDPNNRNSRSDSNT